MLVLQGCGGGGGGGSTTQTTTPNPVGPTGLYWCEGVATYYKTSYFNGTTSAAGQCLPSASPGAYYTKAGQKEGKDDRSWECFSPDFDKSLWTNAQAKAQNYEGACLFKDFSSKVTPGDVDLCSAHLPYHPSVCAPGPSTYWGACWSSRSENWKCIPVGDATIPGLAKGDCKANVLLKPSPSLVPTKYFYDGACRFEKETPKIYKCDTVPDYSAASGSTCGQKVDTTSDKACFSLKSGVQWQCVAKGTAFTTPCDWTLQPDLSKEFYKASCVFPQNDQYKTAIDASNLTLAFKQAVIV